MSYLVLARKYRPETFEQVVGQEPIARTLQNALKSDRLAHAYLFTGPRGVGKTSLSRILAKALRCKEGPTPNPCGSCEGCRSVAAGNDLDVLEIDGASNRGIENIRELRENVRYAPASGRYKVYIVDEVHQITHDAFNAFLKTLEEPPSHVVFVFATTEPSKVPETIRSRCQEFEFRRIPDAVISETVRDIAAREGYELEAGMDVEIARRARGGLRDAFSLLDQLAAFGGEKATFEAFRELTGFVAPVRVQELIEVIRQRQGAQALAWIDQALAHGASTGDLLDQVLDYLRALMHRKVESKLPPALPGVDEEVLRDQIESLDASLILGWMQVLVESRRRLRDLDDERLILEMAVLEMTRVSELPSLADALRSLGKAPAQQAPAQAQAPAQPPRKARESGGPVSQPTKPASTRPTSTRSARPAPEGKETRASRGPTGEPSEVFERLMTRLKTEAPSLVPWFSRVEPVTLVGVELTVRAPAGTSLAPPDDRAQSVLRRVTRKLFGKELAVRLQEPPTSTRDEVKEIGEDRRREQLEQIRDAFGGETVEGE